MNWKPAKVGAEPKKIAILVGLVLIAGYFLFSNRGSTESAAPVRSAGNAPEPLRAVGRPTTRPPGKNAPRGANSNPREFRPSFRSKDIDPSKVDPTLHLDLLAKLKTVAVEGGARSLFDIGAEPQAKIEVKEPAKIPIGKTPVGPVAPSAEQAKAEASTPPEPKAPPIPLKFYGFVNPPKAGIKRAFFLDGEDIVIAGEGDLIKKRYKIVRIGVNSAVVEDTQFKSNNQQTLPLEAEVAG
jgi:hypothetical protein